MDRNSTRFQAAADTLRSTKRAASLVWKTSPSLTLLLGALSLVAGALPAAIAWVGKEIVDAVVAANQSGASTEPVVQWVAAELGLIAVVAAAQRGIETCRQLLRAQLGFRVNEMILSKAASLPLTAFEDSEFYDRMTRARREASSRPLSLVMRTFQLGQHAVTLTSYGAILLSLSPIAVGILILAAIPSFVVEARFSQSVFRLFRWRAPETRMQAYLESLLAREDHAKEVKLYGLNDVFLDRYRQIFETVYAEDRKLALQRNAWGYVLGLLSRLAFYGAYAWIALKAVAGTISLGEMTMYLLVFKQGQSSLAALLSSLGQMYEDNLYLSNLYEFLEHATAEEDGIAFEGPRPGDGIRFENVSFRYPGADADAVSGLTLHLPPGRKLALVGENGAGKTTLIKLLTRLYDPTAGEILLDGRNLKEWDLPTLRSRIGVIFQDFVRYQLPAGENVGVGDPAAIDDRDRWREAATLGMADKVLEALPDGYETQLGRWFRGGQELSGGQWQKVALSRAFMRESADILVLDEPTAAMDAEAEATMFQRLSDLANDRMAILISHRFSTVRMADHIVVLHDGAIVEDGTHEALMAKNGRYAHLFGLQAAGYR
ncbi:MAG: ABC transporter ATP-binding protein [Myxococcota bacterium]